MLKRTFIILGLILGLQETYAQYEIRHSLTFGTNYTDLFAKKQDIDDIAVNIDTTYTLPNGVDTTIYRPNTQDTYLDFRTVGTFNWFIGYKLTLDFNQRYSFDVGIVLNKKGYKTEMNTDVHAEDLTFEQMYQGTKYYPLSGKVYRYHEDYEVYRLELPFYAKVNMNSFLSVYGGFNFAFELNTSDRLKPLGTRGISRDGVIYIVDQYLTDTNFDVDGVIGVDALFGRRVSVFIQGEYGLQSIDTYRESGIRFVGVRIGCNYVFKRL